MSDSASTCSSKAVPPPEAVVANPVKRNKQTPQEIIDEFWSNRLTNFAAATTVIPANNYTDIVARKNKKIETKTTQASYEDAVAMCRAKVDKIVKECRRINIKFRDQHFPLEADLKLGVRDCLQTLSNIKDDDGYGNDLRPESVKRVGEIFDNPCFYIDGPTANDVRQGRDGDCWLMSALCTLSNKKGLIEKLCVAHDEAVGVYGFVFHRDGEWISEIVDDFLCLIKPDYDEGFFDRILFDDVERVNSDEAYRKVYQSNSSALYFAQCAHPQETWLPLLEKCYAKAHGDYACIEGGFGGEGIEDLTGGVTSELWTTDILDKDHFWNEELLKVNEEFLFGCSTGIWGNGWGERKGIYELHAYSIQKAVEIDGQRLLRLKNPWGKGEWNGAWSDGSKEWTPEWLTKLDHRFGDDGDFWISYKDLLRKYQAFERTRLFGPEWRVCQTWTTLTVPWTLDYQDTYFEFSISKSGPVVVVLAQLDDRYFRGLEGQYAFSLSFRIHKAGHEDYLVRSQTPLRMTRSVNVELELEAGEYEVRVKVDATRDEELLPIDEVIKKNAKERREKLIRIGLAYDLAHSKGKIVETDEEKAAKEAHEKKIKEKSRGELKKKILDERDESHYLATKRYQKDLKHHLRKKEKHQAKLAEKKARKAKAKAEKAAAKATESEEHKDSEQTQETTEKTETATDEQTKVATESEQTATTEEVPLIPESNPDEGVVNTEEAAKEKTEDAEVEKVAAEEEAPEEKNKDGEEEGEEEEEEEEDDGDDISSVGALSDLSEREMEIIITANEPPAPTETPETPEEDPDEFEKDPWNAVAVVGLRVYHKVTDEDNDEEPVKLKVIRPIHYDDDDDADKAEGTDSKTKGLDVDDSAKDATLEGDAKDKKKSILGDGRKPAAS
ncbi:hypothetical protein G7Z17_g11100 [Cylindrodendrum hubeiense]|uniref:Calpain catalytic domain-containing protein n=1 Tax=Cylindrodendrum hubeiense TaxID=595255 RepID=A0A9P5GY67_9HYPO|nr:hypothetical protein G7Z17_g11100 [Cylindrodendrum hubeiense]